MASPRFFFLVLVLFLIEARYGEQSANFITCDEGSSCVSWQRCVDGFYSDDASIVADVKPADYQSLQCGQDSMCCRSLQNLLDVIRETSIPVLEGGSDAQCGHASYDCVPYFQCIDGMINVDGTGLIDVRMGPRDGTCTNPNYPTVPGICCLIPGAIPTPEPVVVCPDYTECVDYNQCGPGGNIVTDGSGLIDIRQQHTSCYLESGIGGICCSPPPIYVDSCPSGSVCTADLDCKGQALDANNIFIDYVSNGLWSLCPYAFRDGICCIQPPPKVLATCPGDSVCRPQSECRGTALDELNTFIEYNAQGSWQHCAQYDQGVCCINPVIGREYHPAQKCGVRNINLDSRILSKIDAGFGEFPWQAILFYQNYTFICGATLISDKYVLTAAHCINKIQANDIRIRFGEWQVNSFDESLPYADRNIYAVHIHPKFNPRNVQNDIAILELIEPVELQYHINAVCLPPSGSTGIHKNCYASGWGKDSFVGSFQHVLKKISLPYIERDRCQNLLRKTRLGRYFRLHKSFVCAGGEENKDACYGDGGGPLVCEDPVTSQYNLIGITSWGIGCGTKNVPGVYVNVHGFSDWIEGITGGLPKKIIK